MKKSMKFMSRLLSGFLVMVFLFGFSLTPAQAQGKDCTYVLQTTGSDLFKVRQMEGAPQIYEFLCNDNVVLRYRSMSQGLTAKQRSMAILERAMKMRKTLTEGTIKVDCLNGCSVVTVDGKLFITVTADDFKANKSTPDGLAKVWADKLRKACQERQAGKEQCGKDQSCNEGKVITPPEPEKEIPKESNPEEEIPGGNEQGQENENKETVVSVEEYKMLQLINEERAKAGVKPLIMKPELVKIARLKSQDMIDNNYFSHTSPTYGDPFTMMRNFGIKFGYAGENLAGNPSLEGAHKSLMASPGHRKNILNPNYTHIGIGIVEGGVYGKMFTQLFISE